MREQRKKMWLMAVMVVTGYTSLSLLSSTEEANAVTRRQMNMTEEEKRMNMIQEEEKEEKERETAPEEEKKKPEEKEKKKDKEEMKVEKKGKGGKVEELKIGVPKNFWVNEMEEYSPSSVNMDEMEEEMRRRRRRVEERCEEILTEERKEINSKEFLISKKYKLVWCNIFKAASSTWLYNYLRMAGLSPEHLQSLKVSPVKAARRLFPRPSPEQLRDYLGKSSGDEDAGEDYLSFIIVREPFQRLLSAYRDKIEKILPYYRSLRCEMTQGVSNTYRFFGLIRRTCTPSFPQFVDYVLKTERKGGAHNEHWAPYYRFCTPCSTHFDLILRFESLHQDEAYLLEKVPGLSKVVSPMVIHSSHTNYSSILAQYYRELTPAQMLGLIKMYLPDFWLFGYNERPYLDLVL